MAQTINQRQDISSLHQMATEISDWAKHLSEAQLKEDFEGDLYLSWPVGDDAAVEVETYATPGTTFFTLHLRAWDRSGGLSTDQELGETTEKHLILSMVAGQLDHIRLIENAAEAEIETALSDDEPSELRRVVPVD